MADDREGGFERYRSYLRLLTDLQIDSRLRGRVDLSGVVQQTMIEAGSAANAPEESAARLAWLPRVLANNLIDEVRRAHRDRRDVGREVSLDAAIEQSSCRLMAWIAAEQPTRAPILEMPTLRLVGVTRATDRANSILPTSGAGQCP